MRKMQIDSPIDILVFLLVQTGIMVYNRVTPRIVEADMDSEKKKVNQRGRKAVPTQYRRKRPVKKLIIGMAIALCAVLAVVIGLLFWKNRDAGDSAQTAPPPPDKVIHVVAGGNVNITDESVAAGQTSGGYDYEAVFKDVLPVLASGDVTILNFEGILSGSSYGTDTKAAPPELLSALKNAGVDILQTANSYSILDGHQSLVSTIQGIRGAGMTPLGTFESKADFQESGGYIIWEIQGIKVAMMAFTKGMVDQEGKPMGLPAVSEGCVNLLYEDHDSTYQKVNTDGITRVVRNAAAHDPDVMIALVHWGSEESDQVSKSQKKICTLLQEEGVDAIIGTHSHYVQKMEHDPATGNFVAWSLGDFYGDMIGTNYSVLLDLEITQDGATGETKVTGFDYVPIYLEENEDGTMRVLRIEEAVLGYENRYLDRVSEETYNAMKTALGRIKSRVGK